jgi:NADPH-dependent curcumin reductase CurA
MANKRVLLASRPSGGVSEGNFRIEEAPLPQPAQGEVLVKNLWLSLDPYMRGRMSDAKSYVKGVEIGEVMVGQTVAEVIDSRTEKFAKGDKVLTQTGWQLYAVTREATKLDEKRAPLSCYLGILGMPGITAYFGLKDIGQPRPGDTVVVSAASGAVGSVVGQLAKIWGCRAVGIAGGRQKCDYVTRELGFDACLDYKAANLAQALRQACPAGVDVYFDNVGGEIFDTLLAQMNLHSRIVVCGLISDYNATEPYRPRNWRCGEALKALGGYFAEGKLKYRESVVEGLENAPRGLIALLKGENFGKQLVKLT